MTLQTFTSEDLRRFQRALEGDPTAIQWVKSLSRKEAGAALRDHNRRETHTAATDVANHNHTDAANDGGGMAGALVDDYVDLTEAAAPGTPGSGLVRVYVKTDGKMYIKDDAGAETDLTAGGGITVKEIDGTPNVSGVSTIRVTNGDLTDDGAGQVTIATGGGGGGTTWEEAVASGNGPGKSLDDEFADASKTGWTEVTVSGTATWTEGEDVLSVLFNSQTSGDMAHAIKSIGSLTTGDYIECGMRMSGQDQNFLIGGILFTDGTGSGANQVNIGWQAQGAGSDIVMRSGTVTNLNATDHWTANMMQNTVEPWLHFRLTYVSANTWKGEWSPDGVTWTDFGNGNQSFTMTPTHMGMWVSSFGGTTVGRIATFEYFRTSVA
jgi:hypothetical protein